MKNASLFALVGLALTLFLFMSCAPMESNATVSLEDQIGKGDIEGTIVDRSQPSDQQDVIRIAISEWEPYTGERIAEHGMLTALTVAAFEKVGYQTEIVLLPWTRCIDMTMSGDMDAVVGASLTEERLVDFSYSDILWPSQVAFYCLTGKATQYDSLDALAPAVIGVYNGSKLIDELKSVKGITLDPVESVEQNIEKLINGRVDYMIDSKDSVQYILTTKMKSDFSKVQLLQPPYAQDDLYLAFSKKNPACDRIISDFNKGLQMIKEEGTYDAIVERFGLK